MNGIQTGLEKAKERTSGFCGRKFRWAETWKDQDENPGIKQYLKWLRENPSTSYSIAKVEKQEMKKYFNNPCGKTKY